MSLVYLNGDFLPREEARISVLDRGFLLGDGIYEVIPVYYGRPFRLQQHLHRLEQNLAAVRLANPLERDQWQALFQRLIEHHGGGDLSLYLQVTRGVAQRDHAFPAETEPTVFAMCNPLPPPQGLDQQNGVEAITLDDIRWRYCHIKTISLLPNVLLRQQAVDQGAAEAILIRDGKVTEGAASNVFVVRDGLLLTPPKSPNLLPGITRDLILELAAGHGVPAREKDIPADWLGQVDEIWLSSSTREIVPVVALNGAPVGNGKPGPLWKHLSKIYRLYKEQLRHETV